MSEKHKYRARAGESQLVKEREKKREDDTMEGRNTKRKLMGETEKEKDVKKNTWRTRRRKKEREMDI